MARARAASGYWQGPGFDGRRQRLLRWGALIAKRMNELIDIMHAEGGKPRADSLIELGPGTRHVTWSAKNAKRVLRSRRVKGSLLLAEFSARPEYQPYRRHRSHRSVELSDQHPDGLDRLRARGRATRSCSSRASTRPAVGQWYVDLFHEIVPEHPVLQIVLRPGETGAHLVRSGVDKVAFTGSPGTAR